MRVHDFERVETFVTVGHHAQGVCHPQPYEVDGSVAAYPSPVPRQEVVAEHVVVFDHPLEALSIVVVPGAVAAALLRPQVNHLTCEVGRIGNDATAGEREAHVDKLAVVVAEIIIHPHEEELVLIEGIEGAVGGPEEELVHGEREAASEQVCRTFLEGDAKKGLRGRCVVPAQLQWPRLVRIVGAPSVLEGDNEGAGREEGHNCTDQMLEGVIVSVLLRGPRTTVNMLPEAELNSSAATCCHSSEDALFAEF